MDEEWLNEPEVVKRRASVSGPSGLPIIIIVILDI